METALCLHLQGLEARLLCSKYLMEASWSSHWVSQENFPFAKTCQTFEACVKTWNVDTENFIAKMRTVKIPSWFALLSMCQRLCVNVCCTYLFLLIETRGRLHLDHCGRREKPTSLQNSGWTCGSHQARSYLSETSLLKAIKLRSVTHAIRSQPSILYGTHPPDNLCFPLNSLWLYWSYLHQRKKSDVLQSFSGWFNSHRHNHSDHRWVFYFRLGTLPQWLKGENQFCLSMQKAFLFYSTLAVIGTFMYCLIICYHQLMKKGLPSISDGDCIVLTVTRLKGKTTVFKVFDGGILIITLGQ